jgi:hypothetical protein
VAGTCDIGLSAVVVSDAGPGDCPYASAKLPASIPGDVLDNPVTFVFSGDASIE